MFDFCTGVGASIDERPPSADGGGIISMSRRELPPFRCMGLVRLSWRMTCGVPFPLLEASPLYENEDLKEGSIPTVTPSNKYETRATAGR